MELLPVDDHHLGVIAHQRIVGPADGDALVQHPLLELPQSFLAAGIRVRDEGANRHAARHGGLDGPFHVFQVEAENDEVERFLRSLMASTVGLMPSAG